MNTSSAKLDKGNGVKVDFRFIDVTAIIEPILDRNLRTKFAEVMVAEAKSGTPYDTGNNRRSISILSGSNGSYAIGTSSGYGAYLEFGTKHMPARPYFLPAADIAKKSIALTKQSEWTR